jgi:hypothetical protein
MFTSIISAAVPFTMKVCQANRAREKGGTRPLQTPLAVATRSSSFVRTEGNPIPEAINGTGEDEGLSCRLAFLIKRMCIVQLQAPCMSSKDQTRSRLLCSGTITKIAG